MFDVDGEKTISAAEIKEIIGDHITDDMVKEIISTVDESGDGKIDFSEF